ncbi:hypothetical protein HPB52_009634 [Rhipicephalus sanguineus]|uniref:Nlr family card domain protein n=1 Tax=Rhipicephalus sanguineus TaxID=34632 RepID=A0A9D4SQP0_RHISA|nr:hypothetical protein HPB52_009634 [Rhipicephalus sanguineus]
MALAKSVFCGSRRIDLIPCTNSEGRLCHIFRDISLWNEYIWILDLELRELSPGQLSLVKKHKAYVGAYANIQNMLEQTESVATLLHHLLTRHQCVSSAVIDTSIFRHHHQLICDALCKSLSLKKLKLEALQPATPASRNIATALLWLNQLQELEFQYVTFNRYFIDGLSEFLASTRSLTTFAVGHENFCCKDDAVAFAQALGRNQSITTMSFDITLLLTGPLWPEMPVSHQHADMLADCLCGNKTLHTLNVRGGYRERFSAVARPIVMALAKNDTLTNLSLVGLSLEDEDIDLITWLLSQNRTLASLKMITCDGRGVSSRAYSNLAALTSDTTLKELTLDLSRFNTSQYLSLFRALASKPSLKKVTLERFNDVDVAEICEAMRETGVQERFFIGTHCVLPNTIDALTECKELSSVIVMSESFDRFELLLTTLSLLPSCGHVTSLCLELRESELRGGAGSLIAQCITGMTALRKLELSTSVCGIGDAFNEARQELAHALSANKSIRRLRVYGPWFGETETETLADTLQASRTLCELYFYPHDDGCVISLMRKLSPNFSTNYSLLDMRVQRPQNAGDDWFTVAGVIHRNCSLVTRASHFVKGRRVKYCAAAAELVHSSPGLVERVQELASVDENEAASLIKISLKSFSELNVFMRLAGVVKCGVTCHSRDDGQKQLVDIFPECWLCIRKYLKVGDILDEQ